MGARDEIWSKVKGLSHFVEHMLFKGTFLYPNTSILTKQLFKTGSKYNGQTGYDFTKFYIRSLCKYLPLSIDVLLEMIFNSLSKHFFYFF